MVSIKGNVVGGTAQRERECASLTSSLSRRAVSPNAGQGASIALDDAMYLAMLLRNSDDYERIFARFERDCKPRDECVVAEGRRRGGDERIVSPLQSKIRDVMMPVMLNLFGERSEDWLRRYWIDGDAGTAIDR
jgi:2-polyprenyl-6-methoxyphenol hydroxylase-like FAD-dependent oxidoreductase